MEVFLLLYEGCNAREDEIIEGNKLVSGFMSLSLGDCDNVGICIFDK